MTRDYPDDYQTVKSKIHKFKNRMYRFFFTKKKKLMNLKLSVIINYHSY